jgi:colanic acid biosynthesis glycosyl transferase WcaI
MKILFLSDNYPPERNAAASRVHERAVYWARWGHSVKVITGAPNFPEGRVHSGYRNRWYQQERREGIDVVRVKTYIAANEGKWRRIADFLSFMLMSFVAALVESVRQGRPDTIVATSPQFFTAVGAWAASVVLRRPFVFEISDLWPASIVAVGAMRPGRLLNALEAIELFLYRQAAHIVAQTPAFRDDLVARGIDESKISVVLNGVELTMFSPRPRDAAKAAEFGLTDDRMVVGYLGTLGLAHGLDHVIEAAEALRDEPVCFLLLGPGAEREKLMAEVRSRALGNVVIPPAQPKREMPRAWSVCDLSLVHLKDTPVFAGVIPSKIFESMAMGKPVLLASPEGEASRLIEREGAGVAIRSDQAGLLVDTVRQLVRDQPQRARMAEQSRQAAPHYSREIQAKAMLAALEQSLVAGGRHRKR